MGSKSHRQDQKQTSPTATFDRERFEQIVQDVLFDAASTRLQMEKDPEVILEASEYIVEEVVLADLQLDKDDMIKDEIKSGGSLSLAHVEEHPLCGIMQSIADEMLGMSVVDATMLTSDILDEYYTPEQVSSGEKVQRQKRGVLGECEMCERCMMLTEHHLIPRSTHAALLQKGTFSRTEMSTRLAMLCRPCHSFVHHHISVMDLALTCNTVDLLLARPDVFKWAKYASKLKERNPLYGVNRELKNKR